MTVMFWIPVVIVIIIAVLRAKTFVPEDKRWALIRVSIVAVFVVIIELLIYVGITGVDRVLLVRIAAPFASIVLLVFLVMASSIGEFYLRWAWNVMCFGVFASFIVPLVVVHSTR